MNCVHVIGNGESRREIDFNKIVGYKIGCNAAHRDLKLDCLVAVDRRMIQEALDNDFQKPIYTRSDWIDTFARFPNVKVLPELPYKGDTKPDDPWHWGSGPHACNLAATLSPVEIHLWGFDLWGNDSKVNNIYKSTQNYDPEDKNAVDPRYWIYQLARCFEHYPNIDWIQHQDPSWRNPESWDFKNLVIG